MKRTLDEALFIENGLAKEKAVTDINEKVRKEIPQPEAEGRGRKAIHLLLTYMAEMHPEIKDRPEYKEAIEWYESVEAIKAEVKEGLGL